MIKYDLLGLFHELKIKQKLIQWTPPAFQLKNIESYQKDSWKKCDVQSHVLLSKQAVTALIIF